VPENKPQKPDSKTNTPVLIASLGAVFIGLAGVLVGVLGSTGVVNYTVVLVASIGICVAALGVLFYTGILIGKQKASKTSAAEPPSN
jgi:hypothetical protein